MELFPPLSLGWLNGWIFLATFLVIFGILIKCCPTEVVARLYDEQGWTKFQKRATIISKILGVIHFLLLIFTPINFATIESIVGVVLFVFGTIGMVFAIINFKNSPLDGPVTNGLYKISRNPQLFMLYLVTLGTTFIVNSGIALIVVVGSIIFSHFRILGEEKRMMEQYGESYEEYKKKVPRYFLFF